MTFSRTEDRDKTISVTGSRDLDDDGSARQVLAVPTLDCLSYKVRIVAHWEVVSLGNYHLHGTGKQCLPPPLKAEGVIALAKDREKRKTGERPSECICDLLVQLVTKSRVAHIGVECSAAVAAHTRPESPATVVIEMPADAERRCCDAREESGPRVHFANNATAHNSQHAAQGRAGWSPAECVHRDDSTHSLRNSSGAGDPRRATEVVQYKGELIQIELVYYLPHRAGCEIQAGC
jgi:hypothetical protein